jgi:hypothetical protein
MTTRSTVIADRRVLSDRAFLNDSVGDRATTGTE